VKSTTWVRDPVYQCHSTVENESHCGSVDEC
jgi:hypothetical protein